MSQTLNDIDSLYQGLTEEDKGLAVEYLKYLFYRSSSKKAKSTKKIFSDIDELLANEDRWESEEEMLNELAEFRKKKMAV